MFDTKINKLQKKSVGLINTFTKVVEGLKDANIQASKQIEIISDKVSKLSDDEMQLIKLTQSNDKIIANIIKLIE